MQLSLVEQIASGEHAKPSLTAGQGVHSVDHDPSPVQLWHRVKRAALHDHRMLQRTASGHHGNHRRGNQKRRDPAHPLVHRHPTLAADKPLVRRKRIRREGNTPGYQAPASQQDVVTHLTTHRHFPANLRRERSKTKPKRTGKPQRGKSVRRRGNRHTAPRYEMTLDPRNRRYMDHFRDRKATNLVKKRDGGNKTSTMADHRKHTARAQRPLVSDRHHIIYHPRFGKPLKDHRVSPRRRPDSVVDEFQVDPRHPVAVQLVDVASRSRTPVSGSGRRRRRLPVVRKPAAGMSPLEHVVTELHRRRVGPRIRRASDRCY